MGVLKITIGCNGFYYFFERWQNFKTKKMSYLQTLIRSTAITPNAQATTHYVKIKKRKEIKMPIDYTEYHPKWSLISRLIRFKRAGNRCETCGAENYLPHPITGSKVILTVAHIDHNKGNNRFSNLIAECQWCHLSRDLHRHIANRQYGRNHRGKHQLTMFADGVIPGTEPGRDK